MTLSLDLSGEANESLNVTGKYYALIPLKGSGYAMGSPPTRLTSITPGEGSYC
jgi:hypothetical protein